MMNIPDASSAVSAANDKLDAVITGRTPALAVAKASRPVTAVQREALQWLKDHNGTGVFAERGASVLLAGGDRAPYMRVTWNSLREQGFITIKARRATVV